MSDTVSATFTSSSAVFGRLIAAIDRLLMSGARILLECLVSENVGNEIFSG